MNIKFNLGGIKVNLPAVQVDVQVENISYEITEANILEIAQANRELLKAISEFKSDIESSNRYQEKADNEEEERHQAKLAEIRAKDREHRAELRGKLYPFKKFEFPSFDGVGASSAADGQPMETLEELKFEDITSGDEGLFNDVESSCFSVTPMTPEEALEAELALNKAYPLRSSVAGEPVLVEVRA